MTDCFGKNADALKEKKLFLYDIDGTIYEGERLFDGVLELFDGIIRSGGKYVFITNNSSRSVTDYVKKFRKMGIAANEENFFTSGQAAIMLLKEKFGDRLIYAETARSFYCELKNSGLNVTNRYMENAAAVLVGFDSDLTAKKLRMTCEILSKCDIPFYATNPDWACPVEFGFIPDCGSMCFGIERATGKKPVFIGKPSPMMIYTAMARAGMTKEETVVLGDRLYTDIASGVNAGVDTVCVLSGEATLAEIEASEIKPTFVLKSVSEINFQKGNERKEKEVR